MFRIFGLGFENFREFRFQGSLEFRILGFGCRSFEFESDCLKVLSFEFFYEFRFGFLVLGLASG